VGILLNISSQVRFASGASPKAAKPPVAAGK
jgi:hypothetical protein